VTERDWSEYQRTMEAGYAKCADTVDGWLKASSGKRDFGILISLRGGGKEISPNLKDLCMW